jgi:hypothetical protein
MLHKYHIIYSARYYLQFHVTVDNNWNVLPVDMGAHLYILTLHFSVKSSHLHTYSQAKVTAVDNREKATTQNLIYGRLL